MHQLHVWALNSPLWPRPMKLTMLWKIGDEWLHFRNISKLHVFISLAKWPHCFTNLSSFVFRRQKLIITAKTCNSELNWQDLAIPDLTSQPMQKPRLGVAKAGTLKLDLGALKCWNTIFFSYNTFLHIIEILKLQKLYQLPGHCLLCKTQLSIVNDTQPALQWVILFNWFLPWSSSCQ